jgi:hypothetical protein
VSKAASVRLKENGNVNYAEADEQHVVVKTIYPYAPGDTPESVFTCAFVESLRICDQILDRAPA